MNPKSMCNLMMAVEQRESGIVRDKIDFHFLEAADQHNILRFLHN
jgi:hypothetical protein